MTPRPATLWLTGLPGAGKTTLATAVVADLGRSRVPCELLDGDELRRTLSADLGFAPEDRSEHARRVADRAAAGVAAGRVAIVALVSPYRADRQAARQLHASRGLPFVEVWVSTPLAVCEARDPKGLYRQAREGRLPGLTGVDAPYEEPPAAELELTGEGSVADSAARLVAALPAG